MNVNRDKKSFWENTYTPVRFPRAAFQLTSQNRTAFWGSCFARESEEFFKNFDLPCYSPPFGIIYNPITMANSLTMLINNQLTGEPFYHLNLWRHEGFHSSCCFRGDEADYELACEHFIQAVNRGHEELLQTETLIITLGTSYVYQNKTTGRIVNNCHKLPNNSFNRFPYTVGDNGRIQLLDALRELKKYNNDLKVIITVSPVRHLRDDARENSYSKALLRCLCHDLSSSEDYIHYFPSYEIVMDELRDYRWYSNDLCHLTPRAVEYIMERFFEWCASKELKQYLEAKKKERRLGGHRPIVKPD